jgi:hypothetical protein
VDASAASEENAVPGAANDATMSGVTQATDSNACVAVVLVPHPDDAATFLCQATSEGAGLALPCVTVEAEPSVVSIIDRVDELFGTNVTLLRANALQWFDNYDACAMVVEVESLGADSAPGFEWTTLDAASTITQSWAQESVVAWLHERRAGWSALRPQWSRPGWVAEAGAWMRDQMTIAGFTDPQTPRVHYLWGVSAVLSADSSDGKAFLKCSGKRFQHEAAVTQALSRRTPSLLPDVVAIEPDRGWMLMRDFAGAELGEQDSSTWDVGVDALVQVQRSWLQRTNELVQLGAELRPLTDLARWVEQTATDDDLLSGFTADERQRWIDSVPAMTQACRELGEVGPGATLVHGDFHPWNVALRADGDALIFDWTDASVAHPALDVVTYVMRTPDVAVRTALFDRFLACWEGELGRAPDAHLARLVLSVGALHQAHTYVQLIPTLMPEDLSQLAGGDVQWLRRAMAYAEQGLSAHDM